VNHSPAMVKPKSGDKAPHSMLNKWAPCNGLAILKTAFFIALVTRGGNTLLQTRSTVSYATEMRAASGGLASPLW
jgi:hypothetical protein